MSDFLPLRPLTLEQLAERVRRTTREMKAWRRELRLGLPSNGLLSHDDIADLLVASVIHSNNIVGNISLHPGDVIWLEDGFAKADLRVSIE